MFTKKNQTSATAPGPFGRYQLQELINSGGMADLWLATNADRYPVAVRVLLPHLRSNSTARKRFLHGCEVLTHLHDHPYIPTCYDCGKLEGACFTVMEYVEGRNLKERLAHADEALGSYVGNILIDAAEALEHVHDRGFIHLDFKPENIIVSPNGNIRLVDFDISQPRQDQPFKLSKNPGTPAYMAPEQLRREPIDHRVDLFAFGVTAYEVLTGRKPFTGASPEAILRKQLRRNTDFAAPRQLNPDIPPSLEKAILKCLETDPQRRYSHVSVLLHELRRLLYV